MIFLAESIVTCAVFSLFVYLISRDPVKIVYNYPPAIIDRCRSLGLVDDSNRRGGMAFYVKKVTAMALFGVLLGLLVRYVNGCTTFWSGALTAYALWNVVNWFDALEWMYAHAGEIGIDRERIVVGGESAGGGLAAAICLYARDKGEIPIRAQFPLYPMLDSEDTESSADNQGKVWNTRRNHWGWRHYLGKAYGTDSVTKYASPARETDYSNLPPCYTFVCEGEPFYDETLTYVRNLQEAGVEASVDVYHGDVHAFDMLQPGKDKSKEARRKLLGAFKRLVK